MHGPVNIRFKFITIVDKYFNFFLNILLFNILYDF